MKAIDLIQQAADSGVELYLDGGTLKARGCRQAVEILSPELQAHKAEIVELLASARMMAGNRLPAPELPGLAPPAAPDLDSPPSTQPPTPDIPPKPRKLKYLEWADSWHELHQAYQRHHINCPTCIAASKGYGLRCGAGAALYRAYSDGAAERSGLDW